MRKSHIVIFCMDHFHVETRLRSRSCRPAAQGGRSRVSLAVRVAAQRDSRGAAGSGGRLPATRDLARQYALARGTVLSAFEQLKSEGYIEGSVGSGTYVSRVLPEQWLQVSPDRRTRRESRRACKPTLSAYGQRVQAFPGYEDRPLQCVPREPACTRPVPH